MTDILEKQETDYFCKKCKFYAKSKSKWEKHIETNKHENKKSIYLCICGKQYKHRQSLYTHKKKGKCLVSKNETVSNNIEDEENEENEEEVVITKEMFVGLLEKNQELMNTIQEMIPKIGNNNVTNNTQNNKFNLNFFLHEQCKDAMNLTDFVESLKVQIKDLDYTQTNGFAKGVTNVFIKGLEDLDTFTRPVHCSDTKRKTMYIKDESGWDKDTDHEKFKVAISKISKKHLASLKEWEEQHPNWQDNEAKSQEYMKYVLAITSNNEYNENKIITDVAQTVQIEKCND
jgi:hypothetical protein